MKRFLLALVLLLAGGFISSASAHHGWGGGWGGYGGGWGGGYRSYGFYGGGIGYGFGGYRGFNYGYHPRVAYYSSFAPAFQTYYAPAYYAPAYYAPTYVAPAYYYQGCQTTTYSNVIAATVPPTEYYYGPQAAQDFLGTPPAGTVVNNDVANTIQIAAKLAKLLKPAVPPPAGDTINQPPVVTPKDSLPIARARARKMIAIGDRYFGEQDYYQASLNYREASRTAPDLAEANFRLAHAETARGRFGEAAAAYRNALAADPDVSRENFRLNDLYGEDQIAKSSHLETAAATALAAPEDSTYLLVVGMMLRYDGQEERAVKFLRKAWEMGDRAPHLARYWGAEENPKVLVADQRT